ncbi:MAG: GNAT family N-acetyltransferase [Candidatus Dormibacteria bacterium]
MIGTQDIEAKDFALSRSFDTGSWLGREFQGWGFGREMRAAILHLGFAGLGAEEAITGAFTDNRASLGVSRSVGYQPNGTAQVARRGKAATRLVLRLTREQWSEQSHAQVALEGLEPCLALMGLTPPQAIPGSGDR